MGTALRKMAGSTGCCSSCSDPSYKDLRSRINTQKRGWAQEGLLTSTDPRINSDETSCYLPNFDEIDRSTKDLVIGYINRVQLKLPSDNPYYNIPHMIHYITLSYYYDSLYYFQPSELGKFILKKMNNKTLDRLWKHIYRDGRGEIRRNDVLKVLQFTAVLYVAFKFRQGGGEGRPEINKNILKQKFIPVKEWILKERMNKKKSISKAEFRKLFGQWLKQYTDTNSKNVSKK